MRSDRWRHFIPLLIVAVAVLTFLCIPLRILSYGYLPATDALRHAAKAVSGRDWSEILVLREGFALDHNPGWHAVLRLVYLWTHWEADGLVVFAVVLLMFGLMVVPLVWQRFPEAWLAALLVGVNASTTLMARLSSGRPYILGMTVLVALLFLWRAADDAWRRKSVGVATFLLVAAAVWIHGAWYLFALPTAAFFLARKWRAGLVFGVCWLAGSLAGACLTGHPILFLKHAVSIAVTALEPAVATRQQATEFWPSAGDFGVVLAMALGLVWRTSQWGWKADYVMHPAFMLTCLGWLLGFTVGRFWWDWGLPAAVVWLAIQFHEPMAQHFAEKPFLRMGFTGLTAAGLLLSTTSDQMGRWSESATIEFVSPATPDISGWLPGKGGVVFASNMDIFFETFFKNPQAPWRYILGYEPTFMPPEDLAIFRNIQRAHATPRSYEPWVAKMRPADRLILRNSSRQPPAIPELEWLNPVKDTWIGRLPVKPPNGNHGKHAEDKK
jgi:hypothetical protein